MIDWTKLLQTNLKSKEDAPVAIRQITGALSDNILLSMLQKAIDKGDYKVAAYLEEEKKKREL